MDITIFRNFNIYASSAANLVYVERVLSEKLRISLCLFSCLSKWLTGDIVNEQFRLVYKIQNLLTAIFINWESGSTICMNFIWIGSSAAENQTRLFLLLESEFFGQNIDVWPTRSSAVTMATIHLPIKIWLFFVHPPR